MTALDRIIYRAQGQAYRNARALGYSPADAEAQAEMVRWFILGLVR